MSIDDELESRPISAWQIKTLMICLAIMIFDGLDVQLLSYAAPAILSEWDISKAVLAPALTAALVGMALGAITGGYLGDRFGSRRVMILAVALFGTTTIATAYATNVPEMTTLRIISGLGFGAAMPNALKLASEWMPKRAIAFSIMILTISTPIGAGIGGLMSAWVIPSFGWRAAFVCGGAATLVLCMLVIALLPESISYLLKAGREPDARRWLAKAIGPEAAKIPLNQATSTQSSALEHPSGGIFTHSLLRSNSGLWLTNFSVCFTTFAFLSWLPTVLTSSGFDLQTAIHGTSYFAVSSIAGSFASTWLIKFFGTKISAVAAVGSKLLLVVLIWNALSSPDASDFRGTDTYGLGRYVLRHPIDNIICTGD